MGAQRILGAPINPAGLFLIELVMKARRNHRKPQSKNRDNETTKQKKLKEVREKIRMEEEKMLELKIQKRMQLEQERLLRRFHSKRTRREIIGEKSLRCCFAHPTTAIPGRDPARHWKDSLGKWSYQHIYLKSIYSLIKLRFARS